MVAFVLVQPVRQAFAFHPVHNHGRALRSPGQAVQLHDMRVRKLGDGHGFTDNALLAPGLSLIIVLQQFDGHKPIQSRLPGLENHSLAARLAIVQNFKAVNFRLLINRTWRGCCFALPQLKNIWLATADHVKISLAGQAIFHVRFNLHVLRFIKLARYKLAEQVAAWAVGLIQKKCSIHDCVPLRRDCRRLPESPWPPAGAT